MNLVERVKAILLQPKSEWPVIEREPGDAGYLFTNYVCIVSAIPAVCSFIGTVIIGLPELWPDWCTQSSPMCWGWSAFS